LEKKNTTGKWLEISLKECCLVHFGACLVISEFNYAAKNDTGIRQKYGITKEGGVLIIESVADTKINYDNHNSKIKQHFDQLSMV
jgi:hypothetical protein